MIDLIDYIERCSSRKSTYRLADFFNRWWVFMSEYGGDMDGSLGYMINVPEDLSDTDNSVTYSLRQNEGIPDEYISLFDFEYEDYLLYNLVDDSVVLLPDGNIECLNNKTLSKKWDSFNSFLEDFLG